MPNHFTLLENDDAANYIPQLTVSMSIKTVNGKQLQDNEKSDNSDWKQFARFEGDIHEGTRALSSKFS